MRASPSRKGDYHYRSYGTRISKTITLNFKVKLLWRERGLSTERSVKNIMETIL